MDIRPVVTAEDHVHARPEIERLWGAEPGTPDDSLLDVIL